MPRYRTLWLKCGRHLVTHIGSIVYMQLSTMCDTAPPFFALLVHPTPHEGARFPCRAASLLPCLDLYIPRSSSFLCPPPAYYLPNLPSIVHTCLSSIFCILAGLCFLKLRRHLEVGNILTFKAIQNCNGSSFWFGVEQHTRVVYLMKLIIPNSPSNEPQPTHPYNHQ